MLCTKIMNDTYFLNQVADAMTSREITNIRDACCKIVKFYFIYW